MMCLADVDVIIIVLVNFNVNDSRLLRWTPYMSGEIDSDK
jgi:hypothetical protein